MNLNEKKIALKNLAEARRYYCSNPDKAKGKANCRLCARARNISQDCAGIPIHILAALDGAEWMEFCDC